MLGRTTPQTDMVALLAKRASVRGAREVERGALGLVKPSSPLPGGGEHPRDKAAWRLSDERVGPDGNDTPLVDVNLVPSATPEQPHRPSPLGQRCETASRVSPDLPELVSSKVNGRLDVHTPRAPSQRGLSRRKYQPDIYPHRLFNGRAWEELPSASLSTIQEEAE